MRLLFLPAALLAIGVASPHALARCDRIEILYSVDGADFSALDDSTAPAFRLLPDQPLLIRLVGANPDGTYSLKQIESRDLGTPVQIRQDLTGSSTSGGCHTLDLVLLGPPAGKTYAYAVEYLAAGAAGPPTRVTQFQVRVDEVVHVEVVAGPVWTGGTTSAYALRTLPGEEGQPARGLLRTDESEGSLEIAVGGAFRPWGYDPRGAPDWDNVLLFLGLPITSTPLDRVYAGAGWGARGLNLLVGASIGRQTIPRDGVETDVAFALAEGREALDDYVRRRWTATLFASVQVDLGAFGELFPKTSLNR